jgi:type IV pilus assembly protein PilO
MDKLKQYLVFTVLACVFVLAAGWFLLVSPKRSEAADLHTQAAGQVSANAQLETQLAVLKAQAKDLPKQKAKLAAVAAKIPDNPALPALIRSLTAAAKSAGIELVTVTPGQPTAVTGAAAPAAPTAPTGAAGSQSASQPAVAGAGQLAQIQLTLSVAGGYFQVEQFVAQLENLPRAMRINNLALAPGANPVKPGAAAVDGAAPAPTNDGTLTTTITGQVFMAMNRPAISPVAAPAQPATGTAAGPVTPAKK